MAQKKDPAFLFYPDNFILGTYTMTDEQVGKYIRLLCLQFSKGKLTERDMLSINRDDDPYVKEKFKIDGDGLFYNERLLSEMEDRKIKAEISKENGSKGGNPNFIKGKRNPYYNLDDNPKDNPEDILIDKQKISITLEDEDIDINRTRNIIKSEVKDDLKESIKIIIDYLNSKTNKHFKHNSSKNETVIKARLNEGYKLEDFQRVIDIKCDEWLNDEKFEQFLRPETLFSNKFESYLNQKSKVDVKKDKYKFMEDWLDDKKHI